MKQTALLLLWFVFAVASRALATEARVTTADFPLPANGQISVENVRGAIQVVGWDRSVVQVTTLKTAPDGCDCLDKAAVLASRTRQGWAFQTVYTNGKRDPVRVDYKLKVPRQVRLKELSTIQGQIEVLGVQGSVLAETVNGDIRELDVEGKVSAHALNGNIFVSLRGLPASSRSLSFEALNGNLDLILPPKPNAELALSTLEGKAVTPYMLEASSHPGDQTRTCRLGRGGPSILLKTVRGNIRVQERNEKL